MHERPLEDATRIAYRELVLWMAKDYGFDKWDAYMMLSRCGRVRLGTRSWLAQLTPFSPCPLLEEEGIEFNHFAHRHRL